MSLRDRVAEIVEIKRRGPKAVQGFDQQFETLLADWDRMASASSSIDDFFLIRAVTLLEVFTRLWVAALIDQGSPYVERAGELKLDLKFDFGTTQAIHGRVITMGDLLSHAVPLNRFGQILDVFKVLLSEDPLPLIGRAVDTRTTLGDLMKPQTTEPKAAVAPIIDDVQAMRAHLSRLFEVRHILCHELPRKEIYKREEISTLLNAARQFAVATNEVLMKVVRGDTPTTLEGMMKGAEEELTQSEMFLAEVVSRLDDGSERSRLLEIANEKWMEFREAHCDYRAALSRGVIADYLRSITSEQMARSRAEELAEDLLADAD